MNALQLYAATPTPTLSRALFADDVIFTFPSGSAAVGPASIQSTFSSTFSSHPSRQVLSHRLLHTPDTLAGKESSTSKFLLIDQQVAFFDEQEASAALAADENAELSPKRVVRSLVVARIDNGKIASITEEEDHKKITAPLVARRAAATNAFYSPSDNVLSPTSSKLKLVKQKHLMKAKPTSLFGKPPMQKQIFEAKNRKSSLSQQASMDTSF